MDILTKDRYFKETVTQLKEWGFEVWAPAGILQHDSFRYGWVTDGAQILYFSIDDFEGVRWCTECIPSRETGAGCRVYIPQPLTKDKILGAFSTRLGVPYENFDHFRELHWQVLVQM